MNKKTMLLTALSALMSTTLFAANNRIFTGSGADNKFSTPENWDAVPGEGDNVNIAVHATTAMDPAVMDAGFTQDLAVLRVHGTGADPAGTSYLEIASGVDLVLNGINVGVLNGANLSGQLVLKTGSRISNRYPNGGELIIGSEKNRYKTGKMIIEPGVQFQIAAMKLNAYGTLIFKFGTDTVSTLITTRSNSPEENLFDGMLQVDVSALTAPGSYTLVDGRSQQIGGALRAWLDSQGGSFSGTGNYASTNFEVVQAGNITWKIHLADDGQDLVFTVISITGTVG